MFNATDATFHVVAATLLQLIALGISANESRTGLSPAFDYLQFLGAPNLTDYPGFDTWSKLAFVIQLGAPIKTLFSVASPGGRHLNLDATLTGFLILYLLPVIYSCVNFYSCI